jgi:DNA replicative helicase MCM subunit Mcm2 (Cdc46/Mcm family)
LPVYSRALAIEYDFRRTAIAVCSQRKRMRDEASYVCEACGEEIVVPVDLSAGESQEYVEDCPVCCRPNLVHVEIDERGEARVWAEKEAD